MSLYGYRPGELIDRLSILALKRSFKDQPHFQDEQRDLLAQVPDAVFNIASTIVVQETLDLAAINGRIWYLQDRLRLYRKGFLNDEDTAIVAEIAIQLQVLNDQRAEIVKALNKAAGRHAGEEKV